MVGDQSAGADGDDGNKGHVGPVGPAGNHGRIGLAGQTGPTGPDGKDGDDGENEFKAELPYYVAATKRKESSEAMRRLDGDVYFLNMPSLPAARTEERVRRSWPADTLRLRLMNAIALFKPDIISQAGTEVVIRPKHVFEVAYEEIQKSPTYGSGYALRFPRLVRVREDKSPEEADNTTRIEAIMKGGRG